MEEILHNSVFRIVFAVSLASLSAVLGNLGVNLQKLDHTKVVASKLLPDFAGSSIQNYVDNAQTNQSYWKHPLWLFGSLLLFLGSLFDFAALSFASPSLVAPIASLALVSNVYFSSCLLHEKANCIEYLATFIILCGTVCSVVFGPEQDAFFTSKELEHIVLRFWYYLLPYYVLIIFLLLVAKFANNLRTYDYEYYATVSWIETIHRLSYPTASGLLGSQSVIFGKIVAEDLTATFRGKDMCFSGFTFYIFLIFSASFVVPVFEAVWICGTVLGGFGLFHTHVSFDQLHAILFSVGLCVVLGGIVLLSTSRSKSNHTDHPTITSYLSSASMTLPDDDITDEIQPLFPELPIE